MDVVWYSSGASQKFYCVPRTVMAGMAAVVRAARMRLVILGALLTFLLIAPAASAAPGWIDGGAKYVYATNCASIIFGSPYIEAEAETRGASTPEPNNLPDAGARSSTSAWSRPGSGDRVAATTRTSSCSSPGSCNSQSAPTSPSTATTSAPVRTPGSARPHPARRARARAATAARSTRRAAPPRGRCPQGRSGRSRCPSTPRRGCRATASSPRRRSSTAAAAPTPIRARTCTWSAREPGRGLPEPVLQLPGEQSDPDHLVRVQLLRAGDRSSSALTEDLNDNGVPEGGEPIVYGLGPRAGDHERLRRRDVAPVVERKALHELHLRTGSSS